MKFKRFITGHNADGASTFLDALTEPQISAFTHVPGFAVSLLWSTTDGPYISDVAGDPVLSTASLVPTVGETRFFKITFPPDATLNSITDWEAVGAEYSRKLPGLADKFEPDCPGMHTTQTVDYITVLSGELWLELDAGAERRLTAGDVAVLNGVRHAWRNRSESSATMLSVMIGVGPSSDSQPE